MCVAPFTHAASLTSHRRRRTTRGGACASAGSDAVVNAHQHPYMLEDDGMKNLPDSKARFFFLGCPAGTPPQGPTRPWCHLHSHLCSVLAPRDLRNWSPATQNIWALDMSCVGEAASVHSDQYSRPPLLPACTHTTSRCHTQVHHTYQSFDAVPPVSPCNKPTHTGCSCPLLRQTNF